MRLMKYCVSYTWFFAFSVTFASPTMANTEVDICLIQAVEEQPVLYDQKRRDYKVVDARDKAWKQVAQLTGRDVTQCTGRWKSIRDRYVKVRSKKPSGASQPDTDDKWNLFKYLAFLEQHIRPRKSQSNFSINESSDAIGSTDALLMDSVSPALSISEGASQSSMPDTSLIVVVPQSHLEDCEQQAPTPCQELCIQNVTPMRRNKRTRDDLDQCIANMILKGSAEKDENYHFLMSLLPTLRSLDPEARIQFRLKTMTTLYDLEYNNN